MIDYKDFVIPEFYWDYFVKEKRSLFINSYLKDNNILPSEDMIKNFIIEEEEKEDFRRMLYSKYCVSGVMPEIPEIPSDPMIPPTDGDKDNDEQETPDTPIVPPSSGNNEAYDEWFTMVYNVTTTTEPTKLFSSGSVTSIGTMEIDGKQTDIVSEYTFNTLDKHEVKVLLKDTTKNGTLKFTNIPQLKELTIPSSINSLGIGFLNNCGGIEKIISYALKAPSLYNHSNYGDYTFNSLNENGVLYVPKDSNYSSWFADYSNTRTLKDYNWTLEYME